MGTRKRVAALALVLLPGCGILPWGGGDTDAGKPSGDATTDLVKATVEAIPPTVDSVAGLISSFVLGLILLSLFFRRSRAAISAMLTAVADAMTYRINQWKYKKAKPAEEDGGQDSA